MYMYVSSIDYLQVKSGHMVDIHLQLQVEFWLNQGHFVCIQKTNT